jgi:hypothetical protein
VRSLGFQPEPSSHDWHVQPSCQRTDPLPPERALSVQSRTCTHASESRSRKICLSSKLVQATRLTQPLSTHCWYRISTCFPQPGSAPRLRGLPSSLSFRTASAVRNLLLALYRHATERISHTAPMPFRHKPRRKTISLIKDHLEVSANNAFNPSRNLVPE